MTLQFGPSTEITVGGSLVAIGTAAAPIRFLGAQPVRGYWRGLVFASNSPLNELAHVEVAHGGGGGGANPANVTVGGFDRLRLTNSLLRDSNGWGLFVAPAGIITPVPVSSAGNSFSGNVLGGSNVP